MDLRKPRSKMELLVHADLSRFDKLYCTSKITRTTAEVKADTPVFEYEIRKPYNSGLSEIGPRDLGAVISSRDGTVGQQLRRGQLAASMENLHLLL